VKKFNLDFDIDKAIKAVSFGLILFGIFYLIYYIKFGIGVVTSPYQYDYGEGFHWAISDALSHGRNVYHGINEEPYVTMVYTPLYYLTSALGIKTFGY